MGSSKPSVLALDARTGAVNWEFVGAQQQNVASTPVLDKDEAYVYVGDDGGSFYKLHADTGAAAWEVQLGAGNIRCAANVLDGGVLLSAGDPDGQPHAHGQPRARGLEAVT